MNRTILGNSLEYLQTLEDESIDLISTDPPYNTTDCKWETKLSWDDWILMMAQHCDEAVKKGDLKIFRLGKGGLKKEWIRKNY